MHLSHETLLAIVLQRRLRGAFRAPVVGWVTAGLLAGFAWYLVILAVVPEAWDTLRMAATLPLGVDTHGVPATARHYSPPWFYLGEIVNAALPALFLLPWAVGRAIEGRLWRTEPRRRFLALIVLSLFVAFSFIPQKQKHYLLPLLPALAVLLADAMLSLLRSDPARGRRVLTGFGLLTAAIGLALASVLLWFYGEVLGTPAWILVAAGALAALLALCALHLGRTGRALRLLALATAGWLLFQVVYFGSLDLWKKDWHTGTVQQRADYDAERWSRAFERYPLLRATMLPDGGR